MAAGTRSCFLDHATGDVSVLSANHRSGISRGALVAPRAGAPTRSLVLGVESHYRGRSGAGSKSGEGSSDDGPLACLEPRTGLFVVNMVLETFFPDLAS